MSKEVMIEFDDENFNPHHISSNMLMEILYDIHGVRFGYIEHEMNDYPGARPQNQAMVLRTEGKQAINNLLNWIQQQHECRVELQWNIFPYLWLDVSERDGRPNTIGFDVREKDGKLFLWESIDEGYSETDLREFFFKNYNSVRLVVDTLHYLSWNANEFLSRMKVKNRLLNLETILKDD